STPDKSDNRLDTEFNKLKDLVSEWLIASEDLTIPAIVRKLLKERGKTVGTTESCTGGYIAHLLTGEAGASEIYKGSVISYANEIKQTLLRVPTAILKGKGAVSKETVQEMAQNGLALLHTDYVIATSGIMGPDGGTEEKPVGLVWIAVGNNTKIITRKFNFRFDRSRNIELTANNSLMLLHNFILENQTASVTTNESP
ncbi:MAG TPA: CinA family protein, partial [Flavitalea sp.]|nr:CinA family protein [Flavitalea sp.]